MEESKKKFSLNQSENVKKLLDARQLLN